MHSVFVPTNVPTADAVRGAGRASAETPTIQRAVQQTVEAEPAATIKWT